MTIASTAAIFGPAKEKAMPTVADIKARLDAAGVEYTSRMTKAELEDLIPKRNPPPANRKPKAKATTARSDIKITCMVETMDGNVSEAEISIVNPGGCIRGPDRNNPQFVFDTLKAGLAHKLGRNHIK